MNKVRIEDLYEEYVSKLEEKNNLEQDIEEIRQQIKTKQKRKKRYWENKEIENLRSKIYRDKKKLEKMIEEKNKMENKEEE